MLNNYKRMKEEIVKILLNMDYHICFLIGDNGCGKTDVANSVKKIDASIRIFDNFTGRYCDLPIDGKNIVITHRREILEVANPTDSVILFYEDGLYCVCDIEDEHVVQNMFHSVFYTSINRDKILQRLMWNAVSGVWNDYCEDYLQKYLKEHVSKSDECILKVISDFKQKTIWKDY